MSLLLLFEYRQNATASPSALQTTVTFPGVTAAATEVVYSGRVNIDVRIGISVAARLFGYDKFAQDGRPPEYSVVALTPGGTQLCSFENAVVEEVEWSLNGAGGMSFTLPLDDEKISLITVPDTEVQLWRGPDLLYTGVIVRARSDHRDVTFQCFDLAWYFTKRVVGTAETNYLENNDFEYGISGWGVGFDPVEPLSTRSTANWTAEISSFSFSGSKSLKLTSNATILSGITVGQGFTWEPTAAEGDVWYVVAWVYVPSADYIGPRIRGYNDDGATGALGLLFGRVSTTETKQQFAEGIGWQTVPRIIEQINLPIDNSTPKDRWVRLEAPLEQPITGDEEIVNVQVCCPIGTVYWDSISLVRRERLSFNNVDQATIAETLVTHAQRTDLGKSDLRIDTDCPATGVTRTRVYEYFNHELISDCLDEFPGLYNGIDWAIECTPTERTFRTYYPMRGSFKPQYAIVLGKNVGRIKMDVDGEATANGITVLADVGDGAAREEALAYDSTTLTDNLILEKVYVGTPGSVVTSLGDQAERGLRRFRYPVIIPDIVLTPEATNEMLGMVTEGDVVPVNVVTGWLNLNGNFRITNMKLDPKTEELTVTLNPNYVWELPTSE